jgi:hypothetical protein
MNTAWAIATIHFCPDTIKTYLVAGWVAPEYRIIRAIFRLIANFQTLKNRQNITFLLLWPPGRIHPEKKDF